MSSQFVRGAWMRSIPVVATLLTCACSGAPTGQPTDSMLDEPRRTGSGTAMVRVEPLGTSLADVDTVEVHVSPAGISETLGYNNTDGTYSGSLQVPAGPQTFTVLAYDSGATVGTGSAQATVVAGSVIGVVINVFDVHGPATQPDLGPIIQSVAFSNPTPATGESVTMVVDAIDPDGDSLTYQWEDACENGDGAFTAPTSRFTSWSKNNVGQCDIQIRASANGLTDVIHFPLYVTDGVGTVNVSGFIVPYPTIVSAEILSPPGTSWPVIGIDLSGERQRYVERSGNNAVFPAVKGVQWPITAAHASTNQEVRIRLHGHVDWDLSVPSSWSVDDNCGGTAVPVTSVHDTAEFSWTAPPTSEKGYCEFAFSLTRHATADTFSAAIALGPDDIVDRHLSSNAPWAAFLFELAGGFSDFFLWPDGGNRLLDPDWFRITDLPSVPMVLQVESTAVFDTPAAESIAISLFDNELNAVTTSTAWQGGHAQVQFTPVGSEQPYAVRVTDPSGNYPGGYYMLAGEEL